MINRPQHKNTRANPKPSASEQVPHISPIIEICVKEESEPSQSIGYVYQNQIIPPEALSVPTIHHPKNNLLGDVVRRQVCMKIHNAGIHMIALYPCTNEIQKRSPLKIQGVHTPFK